MPSKCKRSFTNILSNVELMNIQKQITYVLEI